MFEKRTRPSALQETPSITAWVFFRSRQRRNPSSVSTSVKGQTIEVRK